MGIEVKTTSGVISGADPAAHGGVHAFLGIPYANPPLAGANRLAAPTPIDTWDGVRACDAYGASAPQAEREVTIIPEPVIAGDNCLNLNVFTPDIGNGSGHAGGMPVLVWIHGGGFTGGCNASPWYHGRGFGKDGIVVVAINYRLGIEGFLNVDGASTNRAVRDWLLALQWVQDNITAFGGDPAKVTLAGQSAGSVACGTLLTVPQAKGTFRHAILMSGGLRFLRTLDDSRRFAELVAHELGVAATREAFASVDPGRLVALQTLRGPRRSGSEAKAVDPAVRRMAGLLAPGRFGPVVDGDVLLEEPFPALRDGAARDIPVLVGTTAEEVDRINRDPVDEAILIEALEATGMTTGEATAYRAAHHDLSPRAVLGRVRTDAMFRLPAARIAEAHSATSRGRTFAYEFQWKSPTGLGSVHCLDVPFAWDLLDAHRVAPVAGDAPPQQLATDMHAAWVGFIRDGDPGWQPYSVDARKVMAFSTPTSQPVDDPHTVARAALDRLV